MKFLLLTFVLITFAACDNKTITKKTTYERNMGYGIPWEKDLDSAFAKAKKEKKTLIVMAVSDNCQWCEKMKKNTLSNPKVAKELKNYVLVMADRETENERNQLPPFKHVPIIFFMDYEKEILDDLQGYFHAEDFLEYLVDFEDK